MHELMTAREVRAWKTGVRQGPDQRTRTDGNPADRDHGTPAPGGPGLAGAASRRSSARSFWSSRAAARSGPIRSASIRLCTRPGSSRTG